MKAGAGQGPKCGPAGRRPADVFFFFGLFIKFSKKRSRSRTDGPISEGPSKEALEMCDSAGPICAILPDKFFV